VADPLEMLSADQVFHRLSKLDGEKRFLSKDQAEEAVFEVIGNWDISLTEKDKTKFEVSHFLPVWSNFSDA